MCLFCGDIVHDLEGAGGLPQFNGSVATTVSVTANSSQDINGLLGTTRWSSLSQTFSFAVAATDYGSYSHTVNGVTVDETTTFSAVTAAMQTAARASFSMINAYTDLNITESATPSTATLRLGMSNEADGSAYAYFPSSHFTGGDIWFGKQTGAADVRSPVVGNYSWLTHMHEIGHALGLKHGHETGGVSDVAMTSFYDRMEYSIMTYRSYLNEVISGGYQNETFGYAQTFMMYDIAALQHMYGADFTSAGANVGNSTYTFSMTTGEMFINGVGLGQPGANRIFRTIWDGGGNDTYDFSNYTANMAIDLRPGGFTLLSSAQLAALGAGNFAQGNVYNALQYQGDARSLMENALGGSGNDSMTGNTAANLMAGGNGADTLRGGDSSDTLLGQAGADQLFGEGGADALYYDNLDTVIDGGADGGALFDWAISLDATAGQTINVASWNVEGVSASGFNDVLNGSTATWSMTLVGQGGADQLQGGSAADALYFDNLDTLIQGNGGFDWAIAYQSSGFTLNLTAAMGVEGVAGSENGDTINASAMTTAVTLVGLGGADTLTGGSGADALYFDALDTITGNGGFDWAYAMGTNAVSLNMTTAGIEGTTGTSAGDTFDARSSTAGVTVIAGGGADNIYNGVGADTFAGEAGTDTVFYTGLSTSYSVTNQGAGVYQVSIGGITDILVDIQVLQFDNGQLFL